MAEFVVRLALHTFLPIAFGLLLLAFDRSVTGTARRIEVLLVPLFLIGVSGGGISGFFAHFFISDRIAESIGWAPGSPFQLEVAFTNLAFGVLGAIAVVRRDGFREATALGLLVFSAGASVVHFMDMAASGNFAPGNLIPGISNIVRPGLLLVLLLLLRRSERSGSTAPAAGGDWHRALTNASVAALVIGATAFGVGYALDQTVLVSAAGLAAALIAFGWTIVKSPAHQFSVKRLGPSK